MYNIVRANERRLISDGESATANRLTACRSYGESVQRRVGVGESATVNRQLDPSSNINTNSYLPCFLVVYGDKESYAN